jgi:hypothetical protein
VSFTDAQILQLLHGIAPHRVLRHQGQSHVSQQDIRAQLTRIFGFEHWDKVILSGPDLVFESREERTASSGDRKGEQYWAYTACYRCTLRLVVRCPDGCHTKVMEDAATGASEAQPRRTEAHDNAFKNAVSYALKRCAIDLGDQFGLSLYNSGQVAPLVSPGLRLPLAYVKDVAEGGDVQSGVPRQESLGDTEGAGPEPAASAPQPAQEPSARPAGASGVGEPQRPSEAAVDTWVAKFALRLANAPSVEELRPLRQEIVAAVQARRIDAKTGNELLGSMKDVADRLAEEAKAGAEQAFQTGASR